MQLVTDISHTRYLVKADLIKKVQADLIKKKRVVLNEQERAKKEKKGARDRFGTKSEYVSSVINEKM